MCNKPTDKQTATGLVREIEALCVKLDSNATPSYDLLKEAVSALRKYKDLGLTRQEAYNRIEAIYQRCPDDSPQEEFIGDILDCICGYAGNKEFWVY